MCSENNEQKTEKRKSFRESRLGSQKETPGKYEGTDLRNNEDGELSSQNSERRSAKTTLRELQRDPPPGFRKFESEVDWQSIDDEIA